MKKLFTLLILFAVSTVFCKELIWEGKSKDPFVKDLSLQDIYDKKFKQSDLGWYYNLSTRSVEITYPVPEADYKITILTNPLDMIGM